MAKFKLDLDPDPEVTVIGISSHVKGYRLCWSLNQALDLHLRRSGKDIEDVVDGHVSAHAVFTHEEAESEGRYLLIDNHGSDGILLKEHRQADFFLVVDDELAERRKDLLTRVRGAEFVLTAFGLPFSHMRAGHKLLLQTP